MMQSMRILVVDDEEPIRESLSAWLQKDGYQVDMADSGQAALDWIGDYLFDLYLVDIKMPGMDGLELLGRIKEIQPDANIIMITAHGPIQTAVEAMKRGACDYICKPFDPDELSLMTERVSANQALKNENLALREQLMEHHETSFEGLVVESQALRDIEEADFTIYRLVQEAMTNALRHGKATEIRIYFTHDENKLRIRVQDNGRGAKLINESYGLIGMRDRIRQLGGALEVETQIDSGFILSAWIPQGEKAEYGKN